MRGRPLLVCAALATLIAGCSALLGIDSDYIEVVPEAGVVRADGAVEVDGSVDVVVDGSAPTEGGNDAAQPEAGVDAGCAGHVCQGVCLTGTSCAGCATGSLFCATTRACVTSCTGCQAAATECWSCGGAQPNGSCEATATAYCFGAGYTHCPCAPDAGVAACPGASQTCASGKCTTCGEPGTDGMKCKSSLDCQATNKQCQ